MFFCESVKDGRNIIMDKLTEALESATRKNVVEDTIKVIEEYLKM